MHTTNFSLDHRLNELNQVAADLRAERAISASTKRGPSRVRVAVGQALLDLGSSLVVPSQRSVQVR